MAKQLDDSCRSTVNLTEVASRFACDGHDPRELRQRITDSSVEIVPFLTSEAAMAAALVPIRPEYSLSLGDRACPGFAMTRQLSALAANQCCASLDLSVAVQLIRPAARS